MRERSFLYGMDIITQYMIKTTKNFNDFYTKEINVLKEAIRIKEEWEKI